MVKRPLLIGCICLIVLISIWTHYFDGPPYGESIPISEGTRITITGQIYQKENRSDYGTEKTNLYLKSIQIFESGTGQVLEMNPKCKIICEMNPQESELPLGQMVKLSGVWRFYKHATNPGQFDAANYYAVLNIAGKLTECGLEARGEQYWPLRERLYLLREKLEERLYRALPAKEASILVKMLLGASDGLDSDVKALYQRNGIVHILSISGLHITMIGMFVYHVLRKCSCPLLPAALIGSVFLLLYGCMTGFSISACRAIGMFLIHMLGETTGRTYDMPTSIGLVMVLMLFDNSRLIYHSGFLLSFTSVTAMGCLYPVLFFKEEGEKIGMALHVMFAPRRIKLLVRKLSGLFQGLWASTAISICTLPIMLYYFYEIPIYAPLVNLFVLPFMGGVMGIGIGLMILPDISWLAKSEHIILSGFEKVCLFFEELPYHTWCPGRPYAWQIVVYYGGLLFVIWICHRKGKKYLLAVLGLVFLLGTDFRNEIQVSFLDVGQGDCIVVMAEDGRTYMFDGGSSSSYNVAGNVIEPFLKYHGVKSLDGVFISHPDKDHVNGIVEMLGNGHVKIRSLYLPEIDAACREEYGEIMASASQVPVRYYSKGDFLEKKDLKITCLHPEMGLRAESNVYSGCFLVQIKDINFLLTGDVEAEGEWMLTQELAACNIKKIHVLKVAHHGSKYSTSDNFLSVANPQLAVISCGSQNFYGHPHEELLMRLENEGCMIMTTPESGAITVKIGKKAVVERWNGGESDDGDE